MVLEDLEKELAIFGVFMALSSLQWDQDINSSSPVDVFVFRFFFSAFSLDPPLGPTCRCIGAESEIAELSESIESAGVS